jgi:peptidyl-prolyl cis-trans isomerase C
VAVDHRIPGETLSIKTLEEQIAERLKASIKERTLRQFVSILVGQAEIMGVDLQGAETPLVQ